MAGEPIQQLREAVSGFIDASEPQFGDTEIALLTFGLSHERMVRPTGDAAALKNEVINYRADGGTPMIASIKHAITNFDLTRAVLVSDGSPTDISTTASNDVPEDWRFHTVDYEGQVDKTTWYDMRFLMPYLERRISIDCVHIGASRDGQAFLEWIAAKTHGLFIKFTNVAQFKEQFKYLAPAYYGLLTSGQVKIGDQE
jgi:hypothetical protein